jgi:hypothetical protein
MSDIYIYSVTNVLAQVDEATSELGHFELKFYVDNGRPAKVKTGEFATFYYYPSGGTIRDTEMNIIFYEPKLDRYRDFKSGL